MHTSSVRAPGSTVLRAVSAPSGAVRKSRRDELTHPFWENVEEWRAPPEAAEYSLTTTTAASERRRRRRRHQGLFLPHPPDCPRMNGRSGNAQLHTPRLQQPPPEVWIVISPPLRYFYGSVRMRMICWSPFNSRLSPNSFIKPFHLSAGGKWEQRVIKQLSCFTTKRGGLDAKAFSFDDLSANLGYFSAELTSHRHPDTRQVQVERERSVHR